MPAATTVPPSHYLHSTRFRDHDELASLIRGGDSEFIQRGRGAFRGEFTTLGLDTGTLQFGEVELPYLCTGAPSWDRIMFIFHLKLERDYVWRGQRLPPRALLALAPQSQHQDISPAQTYWALVSFKPEVLDHALSTVGGDVPRLGSPSNRILLPQVGDFEVLRRRLIEIHGTMRADPSILEVAEARRGIEDAVLSALAVAVESASRVGPPGYGAASRARAARRVEAYLAACGGESLYLADLCAVADVGERTLRNIFQDLYGMSPVRYLKLRRLHQIRRSLRQADPDRTTVRNIATRHGIWHLGRFAMEYRELFGESPNETLKSPLGSVRPSDPRPDPGALRLPSSGSGRR